MAAAIGRGLHLNPSHLSSSPCESDFRPASNSSPSCCSTPSHRNTFRISTRYHLCSHFHSHPSIHRTESLLSSPDFNRAQRCEISSSRFRFVPFSFERGRDGVNANVLIRCRAEAVDNVTNTRSTRGWDEGISFTTVSSDFQITERASDGCTTSVIVEPAFERPFELTPLQQDTGMAFLVLFGAFVWVRLFDFFTSRHILEQKLSRKLVHITSGLLYMLCWPFFSSSKWAPFFAGLVPLANGIRLVIFGLGILRDEGLVKSMSRSGESRELLRGPLYYVLVLYFSTVLFWRRSPVGIIALAMMCGGDGIADIMGRKFGSIKLPYNPEKSYAGSIAMFLFGILVSFLCLYYFSEFGFFILDFPSVFLRLVLISLTATIIESLPITSQLDDNFTVPAIAFLLGMLLFPS